MRKATWIATLILGGQAAVAQVNNGTSTNSPPSAQSSARQEYFAQLDTFKKTARSSYSDEQAREKVGDCPKAMTTYDMSTCLGAELQKTTANYRAYTGALRSIEVLVPPGGAPLSGASGAPLSSQESVKEFDAAEAAWQAYQKLQCSAAYDAYRGGTIAPIMQLTCHLKLVRDRMRELESIYDLMH